MCLYSVFFWVSRLFFEACIHLGVLNTNTISFVIEDASNTAVSVLNRISLRFIGNVGTKQAARGERLESLTGLNPKRFGRQRQSTCQLHPH